MSSKWIYLLAVLLLLVVREVVVDLDMNDWLLSHGYASQAQTLARLKQSPPFTKFIGCWALPVFVVAVLLFWITEKDNANITKQFILLPIVYVPFSIFFAILSKAEFRLSYLYEHPLVILPVGYMYIGFWLMVVWLLGKMRMVE